MHRSTPARSLPLVVAIAALAAAATFPGCSLFRSVGLAPADVDPAAVRRPPTERDEPTRVVVRHVLISFDEANVPGVTRTKSEAERLAARVLELAQGGRDFGELVRLYSDDRGGDGTYAMVNWGIAPHADEREREGMVRGFGRTAFALEVGQCGIVPFHPVESPFGWHILRRTK